MGDGRRQRHCVAERVDGLGTLANPEVQTVCCERLARLDPKTNPKWGRMSAHRMVCHLNDSFRVGTGEKYASPAMNFLTQTAVG